MTVAIETELAGLSAEIPAGQRILDVGCGNRPYEKLFPQCAYLGIDVEKSGRQMSDKAADHFYDGESIPFPDRDFDLVLCTQVFEHCTNPDKLIKEIHRVLRPGGLFFFSIPFMWGEHEVPYDFRRFTSFGCRKFLEENGFVIGKQLRADAGAPAIRALVASELTHTRNQDAAPPGFAARLADKLAWKCFDWALRIWGRSYPFPRVYLDNILIARRP